MDPMDVINASLRDALIKLGVFMVLATLVAEIIREVLRRLFR